MGSSLVFCWDLSNASNRASGSKSPKSMYFPVSICLSSCGGIGGRLGFSKIFATTFGVSIVVVAVDAPVVGGVCATAWEEATLSPALEAGSSQGDTVGGCPDSVPDTASCAPTQLQGEGDSQLLCDQAGIAS